MLVEPSVRLWVANSVSTKVDSTDWRSVVLMGLRMVECWDEMTVAAMDSMWVDC